MLGEELLEHARDLARADRAGHVAAQAAARVLVDDVEHSDLPALAERASRKSYDQTSSGGARGLLPGRSGTRVLGSLAACALGRRDLVVLGGPEPAHAPAVDSKPSWRKSAQMRRKP